jgi:hypothetical protein
VKPLHCHEDPLLLLPLTLPPQSCSGRSRCLLLLPAFCCILLLHNVRHHTQLKCEHVVIELEVRSE